MADEKKILLVISSGSIGGGETHFALLARCLQADPCFLPHIVCQPGGELEQMIQKMNLPYTAFNLESLRHFSHIFKFASLIKNQKPDLIHAHLNRACLWSSLLGRVLGRPVLCTAHGLTTSRYYRAAGHIIAVSRAVKKHLAARAPSLAEKTTVIHNGIPLQAKVNRDRLRILREEYSLSPDERIATVIGKLHPNKGQAIAIRAIKALPVGMPVKLLLVGDGPNRSELEKLISLLSLGPRVVFIPAQARLNEIYHLSNFIVVPSQQEALSLVILEALRQSRPVIASETGGIPEIITHGKNGILFRPGDVNGLAKALEDGFKNYQYHEGLARSGRLTVEKNFALENCYMSTRNIYLKLLGLPIS